MKTTHLCCYLCPVGILVSLVLPAAADPPRKPSVAQFSKLINESPFTIKPPPAERTPVGTPLERDWMLGSIRPGKNGYSVTLINRKDRKNRVRFIPGFSAGEFKLLEVRQDPNDGLKSRVRVQKGNLTAWLTYDEKLIKVRSSAAAAAKKPAAGARPGGRRASQQAAPPVPGRPGTGRTSRQRTVPRRR